MYRACSKWHFESWSKDSIQICNVLEIGRWSSYNHCTLLWFIFFSFVFLASYKPIRCEFISKADLSWKKFRRLLMSSMKIYQKFAKKLEKIFCRPLFVHQIVPFFRKCKEIDVAFEITMRSEKYQTIQCMPVVVESSVTGSITKPKLIYRISPIQFINTICSYQR